MKFGMSLSDIRLLDIGHTIQMAGAIWSGNGKVFVVPFPDEDIVGDILYLKMDAAEWERFLHQSDVMDIEGPAKAILRKSQRHIDQAIAWQVYERDDYRCRYCGQRRPLTVDHIILWENGGATVDQNLVAACRRCNKVRGSMPYEKWIQSPEYAFVSRNLGVHAQAINRSLMGRLKDLELIKAKPRTR